MRYAVFLRGVMPTNLKMADFKKALEAEGCTDVATVLSSGNAVFTATRNLEAAIEKRLKFYALVRTADEVDAILRSDPYGKIPADHKRVVSFVREPPKKMKLPIEAEGARIVRISGREIFTEYQRRPGDPAFMRLLKKTFGDAITTRTWETIEKVAKRLH